MDYAVALMTTDAVEANHGKLFLLRPYFAPWLSFFVRARLADQVVLVDNQDYSHYYFCNFPNQGAHPDGSAFR